MTQQFEQYENTRHVIREVRKYHRQLANLYGQLATRTGNERAVMLLKYMQTREQKLMAALDLYELNAPDKILDAWFQIAYPENLDEFMTIIQGTHEDPDVEQVRQLVMAANDFLMSLLDHVMRCAHNEDVHAVFEDLYEIEHEEEKALTRAVNSLSDI